MSLLNEYYDRKENPPEDIAKKILFDVLSDIGGRHRLEWEKIIKNRKTKKELLESNLKKIRLHLP